MTGIVVGFVTTISLMTRLSESGFNSVSSDGAKIEAINRYLTERESEGLIDLTDVLDRSSSKVPGSRLLSAVCNNFSKAGFIRFMEILNWDDPDYVILVLQPEEGETTIWRPRHV